jgi:hypothetical protein
MPMLRRALIAIPLAVVVLALIDVGSWLIPCAVYPIAESRGDQQKKEQQTYETCPFRGGVVTAGFRLLGRGVVDSGLDWTAGATLALAVATIFVAIATRSQARLAREQIALGREEFLTAHRPLLVVHSIRVLESDHSKQPDDQPLRVQFGVINAGTSVGTVTGSAVYLHVVPRIDRPYLPELTPNNIIPLRRFDVGATDNRIEVASDRHGYGNFVNNPGKTPYLSGYIVYKDGRGHSRTTFFCRQFERFPESNIDGRFVPVDDPDCERTY